jgi:hypothetical protein
MKEGSQQVKTEALGGGGGGMPVAMTLRHISHTDCHGMEPVSPQGQTGFQPSQPTHRAQTYVNRADDVIIPQQQCSYEPVPRTAMHCISQPRSRAARSLPHRLCNILPWSGYTRKLCFVCGQVDHLSASQRCVATSHE